MHMRTPPHLVYTDHETGNPFSMDGDYQPCIDDLAWLIAAPQEARDARHLQLNSDAPELSPCAWFDFQTRQCKYYEYRPTVCREFEMGSEGCIDHRDNLREAEFKAKRKHLLKRKARKL